MKPKVIVITGYGINCDEETQYSFNMVGAEAEIWHINDLIETPETLKEAHILAFPGGFSYGDDTGSGKALANKIKNNLMDEVLEFISDGKLVIGICNGFQVITSLGLLPALGGKYGTPQTALIHNEKARFECRWVKLRVDSEKCVFTKGIKELDIPIAHGEGNFYAEKSILKKLNDNNQIVVRYTKNGKNAEGKFPHNPNGSLEDIAGICDETGRVFGLMPHPERAIFNVSHPDYQNNKDKLIREGRKLEECYEPAVSVFKNAVEYFKEWK